MSNSQLLDVYLDKNPQHEKRLFSCNLCSYRTDRRNNLKRHCSTMHEQSQVVLECCGSNFINKAALRLHTAAYHRHGYVCNICHRVFCRRALLRRHHAVHSGFKEFTCNQCDYATSHRSNLDRHKKVHENTKVQEQQQASPNTPSTSVESSQNSHHPSSYSADDGFAKESSLHCSSIPSREFPIVDPILASLLTRQPSLQGEMLHWVYHSPFDSYQQMRQQLNPLAHEHSILTTTPPPGDYGSGSSYLVNCSENSASLLSKQASNYQLRQHTIDVILGDKKEKQENKFFNHTHHQGGVGVLAPSSFPIDPLVITTVSDNHWSVGQLSCPVQLPQASERQRKWATMSYPNLATSSILVTRDTQPSTPIGVKRQWTKEKSTAEENESNSYIPKKLRMSKRYQTI